MTRRPWWAAVCGAGAIALLWSPEWVNPLTNITAATWLLTIVSLVVAGWVSLGRPSQRGNGILMLVLTVTASATSLQYVTGTVGLHRHHVVPAGVLPGWLVLGWPRSGLQNRPQHWLLRVAFILIPVLSAAANVAWDPRWGGFIRP